MTIHKPVRPADGELRDSARKHVLMQATIITVDGPQRVHVRDLTPRGARISCEYRLKQDWDLVFKRGDLFLAARVVWTRKETAGLQFYRQVNPEMLLSDQAGATGTFCRTAGK